MLECDVVKAYGLGHLAGHIDFFADAVNEVEAALGPHYGQGDAGEPSSGAQVHEFCAGLRGEEPGYGQRVEDVVAVEVAYILARYHVDHSVPVVVERAEGLELPALAVGELREVSADEFHPGC